MLTLALALVDECRGWDTEPVLLSAWKEYAHLFPSLPTRTRFNRGRRNLYGVSPHLRIALLRLLDWNEEDHCVIDSLPIPVLQFHLVTGSANAGWWKAFGAAFGKVVTKKVDDLRVSLALACHRKRHDSGLGPCPG